MATVSRCSPDRSTLPNLRSLSRMTLGFRPPQTTDLAVGASRGRCRSRGPQPVPAGRGVARRDCRGKPCRAYSAHTLVSRIVDSLLFSGGAQPSDQEIHRHEYEANQHSGHSLPSAAMPGAAPADREVCPWTALEPWPWSRPPNSAVASPAWWWRCGGCIPTTCSGCTDNRCDRPRHPVQGDRPVGPGVHAGHPGGADRRHGRSPGSAGGAWAGHCWPDHGGRVSGRAAGAAPASPRWLGCAGVAPDHGRARALGGDGRPWQPAPGRRDDSGASAGRRIVTRSSLAGAGQLST